MLLEFENRVKNLESQVETEQDKFSILEVSFNALRDAQKQLEARCIKLTREKQQFESERSRLLSENLEMSRRIMKLTAQQRVTAEVLISEYFIESSFLAKISEK
jgi:chromosome segregation ATPase